MRMNRLIPIFVCFALAIVLTGEVRSQNKVHRQISNETVEKILQGLDLKFEKKEVKEKNATLVHFDFKRGDIAYRLYNYTNDLWIESTYEKSMKPDDVNRWNAEAKFSRLVLIEQKDKTILSLESQLDCAGGVTDATIRQYINRFDEETKKFTKFMAK
jgi:Putative bacterial sensory transduction regulator